MDDDVKRDLREGVAKEYGFALYRQYGEEQAAVYLDVDLSTLKRWRRKKLTPCLDLGPRMKRYLGLHIADIILFGTGWDRTPGGIEKDSESVPVPVKPTPEQALEAARNALKKPR